MSEVWLVFAGSDFPREVLEIYDNPTAAHTHAAREGLDVECWGVASRFEGEEG